MEFNINNKVVININKEVIDYQKNKNFSLIVDYDRKWYKIDGDAFHFNGRIFPNCFASSPQQENFIFYKNSFIFEHEYKYIKKYKKKKKNKKD